MKDIVTLNELKAWLEHFINYDAKEIELEIERYGKSGLACLLLIRKEKNYRYIFCASKIQNINIIRAFIDRYKLNKYISK